MSNLTDRLKQIIEDKEKGKHTLFAKKAGIPPSTFQGYVDGRAPKVEHLIRIRECYNVNIDWLLTGDGSPYIIGEERTADPTTDSDPEVADLLKMTREIIQSDTGYAHSLKANIRSFHSAVETQTRLDKLEQRILEMEKDRSGNGNSGAPPGAHPAPDIKSEPGRKTGT